MHFLYFTLGPVDSATSMYPALINAREPNWSFCTQHLFGSQCSIDKIRCYIYRLPVGQLCCTLIGGFVSDLWHCACEGMKHLHSKRFKKLQEVPAFKRLVRSQLTKSKEQGRIGRVCQWVALCARVPSSIPRYELIPSVKI